MIGILGFDNGLHKFTLNDLFRDIFRDLIGKISVNVNFLQY